MTGLISASDPLSDVLWLLGGTAFLILLLLFRRPFGALLRLTARTAVSLLCLSLLKPVGAWLGIGLGVNLFNALVLGLLGIPGLGLLLMVRWLLLTQL